MQEAKTASSLNHPGIVTIHDITRHEGIDFIAMELVPGRTLDRVIPRHGLALREALDYGVQIADALAAAHSAGVVHRDVKPANVIVSEHGRVKVLDFGLAKLVGHVGLGAVDGAPTATHAAPVTEQGTIVGRRVWPVVAGLAVLITAGAIGAFSWSGRTTAPDLPAASFSAVPLTTYPVESNRQRFRPMGARSRSAGTESAKRTWTSTSS